jgi:3-phosphoshikimate 1-carboxyvinyltransferase
VEPDASNASYFFAAAAVTGGCVTVPGLGPGSTQGDVGFVNVLKRMGCSVEHSRAGLRVCGPPRGTRLAGIDVDLADMPDMAQTLAVVALFAEGPTYIRNVGNLRIKETDRLAALATELARFGAGVEVSTDSIRITPPAQLAPARVRTYNDHRMAMSFAVAGLAIDGVEILDPGCVGKTFPDFFERFERLRE